MSAVASLPGSFAFAFALILIRSKPNGIAIEDYVLALRKASFPVTKTSVPGSALIDHSKLWQHLFGLSQQSNLYLRGTIESLRSERRQENKELEPNKKFIGKKRKLRQGSRVDLETSHLPKRQRLSPSSGIAIEGYYNHEGEQHSDRILILQMIFQLNQMTRNPPSNSTDSISAISTACDAILQVTKNAQNAVIADKSARSQAPTLNEACQATARVWSAIISNLEFEKDISCTRIDFVPLAVPISSVVRSFLSQLRQHCLKEVERRHNQPSDRDLSKATNVETVSIQIGLFEYNTALITRSLIYIMSTAAKLHVKHQEIFDAIASVFLQYIGESMGLHLFGDPETGCTAKYIVPVPGVSEASRLGTSHAMSAARIEAPYLVEVLRTFVQTVVPENLGCTGLKMVETLQRTLIRGVFGSEDEQVPLPKYPAESNDTNTVHNTDFELAHDEDGKDWFLTQVWELLGWDILVG